MSNNQNILVELWNFLKVRKVWWLAPVIILLILIAVLVILSQSSVVSPFMYALL